MLKDYFTKQQGFLLRVATGPLTVDDIVQGIVAWRRHPEFDPHVPVVWDLRGARLSVPVDVAVKTRAYMQDFPAETRRHGRTAWVVDSLDKEKVLREAMEATAWDTQWEIFRSDAAAIVWALGREQMRPREL